MYPYNWSESKSPNTPYAPLSIPPPHVDAAASTKKSKTQPSCTAYCPMLPLLFRHHMQPT